MTRARRQARLSPVAFAIAFGAYAGPAAAAIAAPAPQEPPALAGEEPWLVLWAETQAKPREARGGDGARA